MTSLNRFIAKLADRSLPFVTILRGSTKVDEGPEHQTAFEELRYYLEHLPTPSRLEQGQPLILYISAMHLAVSGALVVEKEATKDGKIMKQQSSLYILCERYRQDPRNPIWRWKRFDMQLS
jgi:hypothetical protein